jgi:para-nitrobenzyl esterase
MYIWEWVNPSFDGKFGAVHGHDVDASFNLYRQNMCGSGRKDGRKMALALASAWIAFAKTGNPDNELMPHRPKYDAATRATMIFDANTRVVNDPRAAMRTYFARNPAPATAGQED